MPASGMCTLAEAVNGLYKAELIRRRGPGAPGAGGVAGWSGMFATRSVLQCRPPSAPDLLSGAGDSDPRSELRRCPSIAGRMRRRTRWERFRRLPLGAW